MWRISKPRPSLRMPVPSRGFGSGTSMTLSWSLRKQDVPLSSPTLTHQTHTSSSPRNHCDRMEPSHSLTPGPRGKEQIPLCQDLSKTDTHGPAVTTWSTRQDDHRAEMVVTGVQECEAERDHISGSLAKCRYPQWTLICTGPTVKPRRAKEGGGPSEGTCNHPLRKRSVGKNRRALGSRR